MVSHQERYIPTNCYPHAPCSPAPFVSAFSDLQVNGNVMDDIATAHAGSMMYHLPISNSSELATALDLPPHLERKTQSSNNIRFVQDVTDNSSLCPPSYLPQNPHPPTLPHNAYHSGMTYGSPANNNNATMAEFTSPEILYPFY